MSKSRSELRWHLSRGDEPSCLITEQELHQLAELGQLKETDLLWKPGLIGWRRADAIPGILTPPLPEESDEPITRASVAAAVRRMKGMAEFALVRTTHTFAAFQILCARSATFCKTKFEVLDTHARSAAEHLHQALGRTRALGWIDRPGGIAILLGLTLIFGTLNFVIQGFTVEPDEASAATSTDKAISCPQLNRSSEINHTASSADTFAGFALLTDFSGASEPDSSPVETVPLPTRKPANVSVGKSATRTARAPKQMRFGTLGFAYDPQN